MSTEEDAGPSGSRHPRAKIARLDSYCGLTESEVRSLRKYSIYLLDSEEEPFPGSESDYLPSSEDESDSFEEDPDSDQEVAEETVETEAPQDELPTAEVVVGSEELQISWTKRDFIPIVHEFDGSNSGITDETLRGKREIDFFLNLFTPDIATTIIEETNRYAIQQNTPRWSAIDLNEFFVFIGITMLMTRNKKLTVKEFWSRDELLHSPIFGKKMTRDRYLQIYSNLHFCDNENAPPINRLYKVDHILSQIKERFQTQFRPFQDLVIDESLILFKGRLSFKQFIKSKRHRFGIKLFVLCDCETGIVLDFIVYLGKSTSENLGNQDLGISGAVVTKLMDQYLNKGHSLFTDNYYSSPSLSTFLFKNKTNSCGTVRPHRKHMPKFTDKLNKGDVSWYSSDHLLVLKWKDRRDVHMITTMHANEIVVLPKVDRITKENVRKPRCVVEYNSKMGAVDRTDMMISSIDCMRKSIKWYKKLFFHVIDVCLLNAHGMLLTTDPGKMPLATFQLKLIRQLFERLVNIFIR